MIPTARASLVIPAHNEESVIARCLRSVVDAGSTASDALEVVVVANACTDRTAEIAREYVDRLPGLRVVERSAPGKIGALNAGDEAATAFPRIYLDADIELGPGALEALIGALDTEEVRVGAPRVSFDLSGCDAGVRSYYRVFSELPYVNDALIGLGIYGLSRSGRARFGPFPDVVADDLFVDRLFAATERHQSAGVFTVRAPRSLTALLAVRTRVARGNAELADTGHDLARAVGTERLETLEPDASTRSTVRALVGVLVQRPGMVLDVAAYVGVTLLARLGARRAAGTWLRDDTTR